MPAWMAWYRNTACIASRTGSLPRKEKDRFETPPEMWACGRVSRMISRRLDEVDAVIVVLLDAGRDREDVRIEDDVLGREADLLGQDLVGRVQISTLRSSVSAWPCSSKAMTTTAAP